MKKDINKKVIILTNIIIFAVISIAMFVAYYVSVTPFPKTINVDGKNCQTTIYSDTRKAVPMASNTQFLKYEAVIYMYHQPNYGVDVDTTILFRDGYEYIKSAKQFEEWYNQYFRTYKAELNGRDEQDLIEIFNSEFFETKNLAIMKRDSTLTHHYYRLRSVVQNGNSATINYTDNYSTYGGILPASASLDIIALDKSIETVSYNIYRTTNVMQCSETRMYLILAIVSLFISILGIVIFIVLFRKKEKEKIEVRTKIISIVLGVIIAMLVATIAFFVSVGINGRFHDVMMVDKPVIYIYPEKDTNVTVKLGKANTLTCSYPQYDSTGWKVSAKPNGDLIDLKTGRQLYSLYYENSSNVKFKVQNDGFVVKGEDTARFLEEKLEILGLNQKETQEFIIYWLPKLEKNKYNYIRFAKEDEIDNNMPLEISTKPDTLIRVLMTYKPLNKRINVQEQELERVERNKFVVVEWGGTEIK